MPLARARSAEPLYAQARLDPSLRVHIAGDNAQLSLNTGANGSLVAQLRISDGTANVRLSGAAASLFGRHSAELSLGLAATGLRPGHVEILSTSAATPAQASADANADPGRQQERGRSTSEQESDPEDPARELEHKAHSSRVAAVHVKA